MNSEDKANKIAQGIANARKVMQKVESNDFKPNNNGGANTSMQNNYSEKEPQYLSEQEMKQRVTQKNNGPRNTMKNVGTSKMPKEILESLINNPIVDPTSPVGLDSIVNKVNESQEIEIQEEPAVIRESVAPVMDTKLIEYIIKKTVEETVEAMNKKTSIDETIQIKIGQKTFGGKLVTLKENNNKK